MASDFAKILSSNSPINRTSASLILTMLVLMKQHKSYGGWWDSEVSSPMTSSVSPVSWWSVVMGRNKIDHIRMMVVIGTYIIDQVIIHQDMAKNASQCILNFVFLFLFFMIYNYTDNCWINSELWIIAYESEGWSLEDWTVFKFVKVKVDRPHNYILWHIILNVNGQTASICGTYWHEMDWNWIGSQKNPEHDEIHISC